MKLYTNKIEVSERQVNATITQEMIDDLKKITEIDYDREIREILLRLRLEKIEKIKNKINE